MEPVNSKKGPQNEGADEFQKELERLTALDAEWRKYFAAQDEAPPNPQKPKSPSLFFCE
jgi:hypothetical protein